MALACDSQPMFRPSPAITADDLLAIRTTFDAAARDAHGTAARFYANLFALDPPLRGLFHGDMRAQGEKLISMLQMVVANLEHLERLLPTVRQLGQRHVHYGVKDEHYATVGTALIQALQQGSGPAWTPEAYRAWSKAYDLLADTMIAAAREVASQGVR
jgi:hemoglobin-like flavoprotein